MKSDARNTPATAVLVNRIIQRLSEQNKTLSVAESCTGGMLGAAITSVRGSSKVFLGGIIAYANCVKENMLGVPNNTLRKKGSVSKSAAAAMASGVRKQFCSDVASAITGIAGPEGGSKSKPVGTVFISVDSRTGTTTLACRFTGGRNEIRRKAVRTCLSALLDVLE